MALDGNTIVPTMPVSPTGGDMLGGLGGGGGLLLLFFLLILCGGNGFGGFGNGGNGFEWLNNSQNINDGFRSQALDNSVGNIQNGVTSGFGDVQTALCGGFAGVNATITNGFANAETAATSRQMANMNQAFAYQTAMSNGFSSLASQLSQCCCDNRMATVQTQNIVQAEGAATRLAIQNQTQQILDKLCAQEIETLRSQNVSLQNQLNMANLAASQTAQSQYIIDKLSA